MPAPRVLAEHAEQLQPDDRPDRERVNGYGVMGLPFDSGHILAHRRFPATSLHTPYTSIWHRNPEGDWTFYASVEPLKACNRAFGSAVKDFHQAEIHTDWTADDRLTLEIHGTLKIDMRLDQTPVTRLMNAAGSILPEAVWQNERAMNAMGSIASRLLGAGKLRLAGHVPNGQDFIANPRLIWTIPEATATLRGEDLGEPAPVEPQAWLEDFAIPNRGLFVFGNGSFEPLDETRHRAVATMAS